MDNGYSKGYPQNQDYNPGYNQGGGYPQPQGYPQSGHPPQGYPPQGYPSPQDYNQQYSSPQQHYPPQPNTTSPAYEQPAQHLIPGESEKFAPAPRFNDIWAAILYFIFLAGFIVSAAMYIRGLNFSNSAGNEVFGNDISLYLYSILVGGIGSVIASLIYLFLMQAFPGFLIRVSFWFAAAMYFVAAILFFKTGGTMNTVFGVLSVIGGVIYIFLWFSWRHKIPFAILMLKNVTKFVSIYWGTIISSILFLIVSFGFYIVWALTSSAVLQSSSQESQCRTDRRGRTVCNNLPAKYYIFYIYLVFVLFWTTQLLRDLSHMTVSGAFGSFYFFPNGGKFTTAASAGRALTTSFGSGCFGSLLIAIMRTLRFLASQLRSSEEGWLAFVGCCLECLIGMVEGLLDYFNTYAYTYCAMYGKPYLEAGKSTWNLIKDRGIEAIINDNLIGNVLTLGSFLIGGIAALLGFLFILIKGGEASKDPSIVIVVVLINLLVGSVLFGILSSVIDSANVSFFVCLAEDPQALAATNPELFEKIRQTYPEVVQSV